MAGAFGAIGAAVVLSLGHVAIRKAGITLGGELGTAIMILGGIAN